MNYKIFRLSINDYNEILKCLGNGNIKNVKLKDRKIIKNYFKQGWIGYGAFITDQNSELLKKSHLVNNDLVLYILIGYCFIKHPNERPETITVVRKDFRNQGIATNLRNYALKQREFNGHIVYSSVKYDNSPSLKSVVKSGFQILDITKDGYIQFIKVLSHK